MFSEADRIVNDSRRVTELGRTLSPDPILAGAGSAVAMIRQMIIRGELRPGQRLPPERELATRLNLSRSSIREAIRALSALNILVARRGSGTYVTTLTDLNLFGPLEVALQVDPSSLMDLIELRRILEPPVAAAAAAKITDANVAELDDLCRRYAEVVNELSQAPSEHLRTKAIELDERIHELIAEVHGNPLVMAVLTSVRQVGRNQRHVTVEMPKTLEESLEEIEAVIHALKARDPMRALATMTRHLSSTEEAARQVLEPRLSAADPV